MEQLNLTEHHCVKAQTLPKCEARNLEPVVHPGPVVIKVPTVLAEAEIQCDVEAEINVGEPFYEIKRIKKDVYLTQCRLLASAGQRCPHTGRYLTGKLFLRGYVEKNIEFATECGGPMKGDCVIGEIKDTIVKVPFQCLAEVEFIRQPQIERRSRVFETNLSRNDCGCRECEELLGPSTCESELEEEIFYVERPYCELDSAKIFEVDVYKKHHDSEEKGKHEMSSELTEKMVIKLKVKVLQLQQIKIKG